MSSSFGVVCLYFVLGTTTSQHASSAWYAPYNNCHEITNDVYVRNQTIVFVVQATMHIVLIQCQQPQQCCSYYCNACGVLCAEVVACAHLPTRATVFHCQTK